MQRDAALRISRRKPGAGELAALSLLGFGAGLAAGFLLSEMLGSRGHRRVGRLLKPRPGMTETAEQRSSRAAALRAALAAEPTLARETIEVRARARGVELRGWVATRQARTLAYRVARAFAGDAEIINHLHVREDDTRHDTAEESAPVSPSPSSSIQPRSA